ncbi:MAG: murein hydrolase activator EnvC family protein [Deltaproteobacteria bacterium]
MTGPWLALALAASAAASGGSREKLQAVTEELRQEQLDVERLGREEVSLLGALDEAERAEADAARAAGEAISRQRAAERELAEARQSEAVAERRAQGELAHLEPRLRVWQRLSGARRLDLLLDARSIQEASTRKALLERILGAELSAARGCLADLKAARDERQRVAELASDLERRSAQATLARQLAHAQRSRHAALLAAVQGERSLHAMAAAELKVAQSRLSAVVRALPPLRMDDTGFRLAKGTLPRPCAGHVEVGFGQIYNPRWGTVTLQKGLDIRAAEGSRVSAVHRGRVVHAAWLSGYGNLMIVDHGDGYYTLFAHLASMEKQVDDLVEPGDPLGTVGATGSLKGPYLYFEIRHHGEAQDPSQWLVPE